MSKKSSQAVRVNLSVGKEEYQRLFVHALMSGRSAGEIVTEIIARSLKDWSLPANLADRAAKSHRPPASDPVSNSAAHEPSIGAN